MVDWAKAAPEAKSEAAINATARRFHSVYPPLVKDDNQPWEENKVPSASLLPCSSPLYLAGNCCPLRLFNWGQCSEERSLAPMSDPAWEVLMSRDEPLRPDDFPVEADKTKLKTQKGEDIASVKSERKAEDIAHRLNEQAQREEEDRWSA